MKRNLLLLLFALVCMRPQARVLKADSTFFEMSLEQLMNIEISVASLKDLTARESPGIITLITEEEIRNSGAQDILELLKRVPGFDFGTDVEGVISLGIRGNWAHEGKFLLMIDGQEMNEALYSTLQFGNHYPIAQVKKIEIIRGPGSSVYGGNAEYAVINIITKNNKDFSGISASATYGRMKNSIARRNISVNAGQQYGSLALNIGATFGEGNRSENDYTDYAGTSVNMANKNVVNPSFVEMAASYKNLSLRAIADMYHTTTIDGYDALLQQPYNNDFNSYYFEAKYKINFSPKFSVTPRFNFKKQTPWNYTGASKDDEFPEYNRTAFQQRYNITCNYDVNDHVNIIAGAENYNDMAEENSAGATFNNGETEVSYNNKVLFAQTLWSNKIVNITAGARYHDNSSYKPSFVPRIGLTKTFNRLHTKLLLSKAYRAPGIDNIDLGTDIMPENTTVAEFETGYMFSEQVHATVNLFDITTHDVIVYYYDGEDGYRNGNSSGTKGIETALKIKGKKGYADVSYSFYTTQGKPVVADYSAGENTNVLLAFPAHKITFSGTIKVAKHFSMNANVSWNSERYSFVDIDTVTGINITQEHKPQLFAGIFFNFDDIFVKGFSAGIGCSNILDEKEIFIQPYNSYHNPLPGLSREIRFRLAYDLKFKQN